MKRSERIASQRVEEGRRVAQLLLESPEGRILDGTLGPGVSRHWQKRFDSWEEDPKDRLLIDEACPWCHEHYAYTPPFYRSYGFVVWHRLAQLAGASRI